MGMLSKIFTWWDGATIGTLLNSWRTGKKVGEDAAGNRYFSTADGARRWVLYAGANDASRVSPDWHGWLHHTHDMTPDALPPVRAWQQDSGAERHGHGPGLSARWRATTRRHTRGGNRRLSAMDARRAVMAKRSLLLLAGVAALAGLSACNREAANEPPPAPKAARPIARAPAVAAGEDDPYAGVTPVEQRVAVLGLLNKRNGLVRDITLKPGESIRIGRVVVRLRSCERTAQWEMPSETGAFVQLLVLEHGTNQWRRRFSGWLFKERPDRNVVQHPIYDVFVKSCTMSWPGEVDVPDEDPAAVLTGAASGAARPAAGAAARPAAAPAAPAAGNSASSAAQTAAPAAPAPAPTPAPAPAAPSTAGDTAR